MKPIFSNKGVTIGWKKENIIYDINGNPRAFINKDSIFNYNGNYIGRLQNGYIREKFGNAAGFLEHAENGPIKPIIKISNVPPIPKITPIQPIISIPPIPSIPSYNWSSLK